MTLEPNLLAICACLAGALRVTALQPSAAGSVTGYWTQSRVANLQMAVTPGTPCAQHMQTRGCQPQHPGRELCKTRWYFAMHAVVINKACTDLAKESNVVLMLAHEMHSSNWFEHASTDAQTHTDRRVIHYYVQILYKV